MPLNRNLRHRYSKILRKEKQLDVENPRWKVLSGEHLLGSCSGKQFEAALCIPNVTYTHYSERGMQAVHEDVPEQRTLNCAVRDRIRAMQGNTYFDDCFGLDEMCTTSNDHPRCTGRSNAIHLLP